MQDDVDDSRREHPGIRQAAEQKVGVSRVADGRSGLTQEFYGVRCVERQPLSHTSVAGFQRAASPQDPSRTGSTNLAAVACPRATRGSRPTSPAILV